MGVSVRKARLGRSWFRICLVVLTALPILALLVGIAVTVWPSTLGWEVSQPFIAFPPRRRHVENISVGFNGTLYVISMGDILRQEQDSEDWLVCSESIPHGVSTVFVDPYRHRLIAGTYGGAYWSEDGLGWERLGERIYREGSSSEDAYISVFALDQEGTLYAVAQGSTFPTRRAYARIFRLATGDRWVSVVSPVAGFDWISALAFGSDDTLYLARNSFPFQGIYRIVDGNKVQQVQGGLPDEGFNDLLVTPGGTIYASSPEEGVYRSDDGKTWHAANDGLESLRVSGLVQGEGDVLYLRTADGGAFRSDDGVTWRPVHQKPTGLRVWLLAVGPSGDLFAGNYEEGLVRSMDGETWQAVPGWPAGLNVDELQVARGGKLYASTSAAVFTLTDRDKWDPLNEGLPYLRYPDAVEMRHSSLAWVRYARLTASETGVLYAGTDGKVFRLSDEMVWQKVSPSSDCFIDSLLVRSSTHTILVADYDGVYRSVNGGEWREIADNVDWAWKMIAEDRAGALYIGTESALYRSMDGEQWDQVASFGGCVRDLVAAEDGTMYVGTDWHMFSDGEGVIRSIDGVDWESFNEGLTDLEIQALEVGRDGVVYAGTESSGVFLSVDGEPWEPANDGLTSHSINDLAVGEEGTIYAATEGGGVFRSEDGLTWEPINDGLTHYWVDHLFGDEKGNLYAASSDGRILRSSDGKSWESVMSDETLPQEVDLIGEDRDLLGWRAEEPPEKVASCCDGDVLWTAVDGQIWLSRDGRAWLPAVSFPSEVQVSGGIPLALGVPQVVAVRDGCLDAWGLAESRSLLYGSARLPVIWRLPAGCLTLAARAWDVAQQVSDDPKPVILALGLLVTFTFALSSEARRAGRMTPD